MEEYKFEGIYKNKYCLKVFLNYCALNFTYRLVMRTRLQHYCNARSSFFQSQFVSGFPSTVKLLPVKHWENFRIFEARSLNSWGNTEISNEVSVFRPQASQAKNTWCKGQFVYIENCKEKSPIMKKKCVIIYLIWNKIFLPQMCGPLVSCTDFKVIPTPFSEVIWNRYSSF